MRRALQNIAQASLQIAPIALFIVIWGALSALLDSTRLPSPIEVLWISATSLFADPIIRAQGGGSSGYLPHVAWTFQQVAIGLAGGSLLGIGAGLLVSRSREFLGCAGAVIEFVRAMPPLILVPIALTVLPPMGFTEALIVGAYAALTQFTYAVEAGRNVPTRLLDVAHAMGARGMRLTKDVLAPAALAELFGAVRVVVVTSIGIAIVVEYLAMPTGIGRVMSFAASFSRIDLIIVGIMWAIILTLMMDGLLSLVSRWCLRWRRAALRPD